MTPRTLAAGALALTVAASTSFLAAGAAGADDDFNISINTHGRSLTSCDQIEATARNAFLARGEETIAVPHGAPNGLRVSGPTNGGLHVRGASRADYEVRLCKFAAGDSMANAAARVDQIKLVTRADGVVTTTGPSGGGWQAQIIVQAPPDARLSLNAMNGPLSVESTSGQLVARAMNGPLSVRDASGQIDANAENGPLAISGVSGTVKATAMNGPLALELSGSSWNGEGLDARVENGPLSLRLPSSYQSGVMVTMPGNGGPFRCRAASCQAAMRRWDDQARELQFFDGTPVIRIAAKNGPVDIH